MKTSLHVNLNKRWRVKWPGIEARIRQQYPYSEPGAGVTWIMLDAADNFADFLDAIAAHKITPREGVDILKRHLDANAAALEDNHDGE